MRVNAFAFAVMALSGCASDSIEPATTTIDGTFILETANGRRLPTVAFRDGTYEVTVLAEEIDFEPGGSFVLSASQRITNPPSQPRTQRQVDTGRYTRAGPAVVLTESQSGQTATAQLVGRRLTLRQDSVQLIFARR